MRITAFVAAIAMASSGCVTGTALMLANPSPNDNDTIGPIMVGGMLVDGISMTALGAGALDGHSSVGWSRGEGEWAMAGGITLLVIDAAVITLLLLEDDHHDAAPASAPPRPLSTPEPPSHFLTVHATRIPGYGNVAFVANPALVPMPRVGDPVPVNNDAYVDFDHSKELVDGDYVACAIYARRGGETSWSIFQQTVDLLSCTTVRVDDAHREITIPPPEPITSPH